MVREVLRRRVGVEERVVEVLVVALREGATDTDDDGVDEPVIDSLAVDVLATLPLLLMDPVVEQFPVVVRLVLLLADADGDDDAVMGRLLLFVVDTELLILNEREGDRNEEWEADGDNVEVGTGPRECVEVGLRNVVLERDQVEELEVEFETF